MIDAKRIVLRLDSFYSNHFEILQMSKHLSAKPFASQTTHQIVTRYKMSFRSRESHLTVVESINEARDIKWSIF